MTGDVILEQLPRNQVTVNYFTNWHEIYEVLFRAGQQIWTARMIYPMRLFCYHLNNIKLVFNIIYIYIYFFFFFNMFIFWCGKKC